MARTAASATVVVGDVLKIRKRLAALTKLARISPLVPVEEQDALAIMRSLQALPLTPKVLFDTAISSQLKALRKATKETEVGGLAKELGRRMKDIMDGDTEKYAGAKRRAAQKAEESARARAAEEAEEARCEAEALAEGEPSSVKAYRARLVKEGKDLYKDPPMLPPPATVKPKKAAAPSRDKHGNIIFADAPDFAPNLTPEEVLRMGSFGGTYFRSIVSAVTGRKIEGKTALAASCPPEWTKGMDVRRTLTSQTYRKDVNKFGVKCGGSLGMWESSGWISAIDEYGWFQWYCRFYVGRRSSDDERQIARWHGVASAKGRFRNQLIGKVVAARTTFNDPSISPVIRQSLQHWGKELTGRDVEEYRKLKGI